MHRFLQSRCLFYPQKSKHVLRETCTWSSAVLQQMQRKVYFIGLSQLCPLWGNAQHMAMYRFSHAIVLPPTKVAVRIRVYMIFTCTSIQESSISQKGLLAKAAQP